MSIMALRANGDVLPWESNDLPTLENPSSAQHVSTIDYKDYTGAGELERADIDVDSCTRFGTRPLGENVTLSKTISAADAAGHEEENMNVCFDVGAQDGAEAKVSINGAEQTVTGGAVGSRTCLVFYPTLASRAEAELSIQWIGAPSSRVFLSLPAINFGEHAPASGVCNADSHETIAEVLAREEAPQCTIAPFLLPDFNNNPSDASLSTLVGQMQQDIESDMCIAYTAVFVFQAKAAGSEDFLQFVLAQENKLASLGDEAAGLAAQFQEHQDDILARLEAVFDGWSDVTGLGAYYVRGD